MSETRWVPPALPPECTYTSCYCEENIYLLADALSLQAQADANWPWDTYVVFISNDGKTVALWSQKAREDVVVWDYHVILVLLPRPPTRHTQDDSDEHRPRAEAWVYDFDTSLSIPCKGTEYIHCTFPYASGAVLGLAVAKAFHPLFRVVPAAVYLDGFASDRSHMRSEDPVLGGPIYKSPPPPYTALCGRKAREKGITNNLMQSFATMSLSLPKAARCEADSEVGTGEMEFYGEVMESGDFVRWLSGTMM